MKFSVPSLGRLLPVFSLITGVTTLAASSLGCNGTLPADSLKHWTDYGKLWATANNTPRWLVLKCTFSDDRNARTLPADLDKAIPDLDTYIGFQLSLMGGGTGNVIDYFYDVTYSGTLLETQVHGWFDAPYASNNTLNRVQRVEQCASAVPDSEGISFSDWDGIIIVTNKTQDGGAGYVGKGPVNINGTTYNMGAVVFDSGSLFTAFAAHEIGHGLGFNHSYDNSTNVCATGAKPGEYCDPYDIMSAMVTWQFHNDNYPAEGAEAGRNTPGFFSGGAGPGMNLPNLLTMNAIPGGRLAKFNVGSGEQTFTLTALSHPLSSNPLGVQIINPNSPNDTFTLEYRQADGWDAGFPVNAVFVHEYKPGSSPSSILYEGPTQGGYVKNGLYINQSQGFVISVTGIDTATGTATVSVNSYSN